MTKKCWNKFVLKLYENNKIVQSEYYTLWSSEGHDARTNGLPKIHKQNDPLRPIVSMIGIPI